MGERENEMLRKKVLGYDPMKNDGGYITKKISIHLFGKMGHGKSTFINNCSCVVKDTDYENKTGECPPTGGSVTNHITSYGLTNKVEIVDNQGLNDLNSRELYECYMQMDGARKTSTRVNTTGWTFWARFLDLFKSRTNEWYTTIQVPVFIYKADTPRIPSEVKKLGEFANNTYYYTGIYPIIVLMFANKMKEDINSMRGFFGSLHCTNVFLLENYHENATKRNEKTDREILKILSMCLSLADNVIKRIGSDKKKPTSFE